MSERLMLTIILSPIEAGMLKIMLTSAGRDRVWVRTGVIECPKSDVQMLKIIVTGASRDKVWVRTGVIECPNAIEPLRIFVHLIGIYCGIIMGGG